MKTICPECGERFEVSSEMVGKKAKCGECAHVFVVPELAEKKPKKRKDTEEETVDVRETAWISLYLAGIAVMLLLYQGHHGGMIATLLFALAIEGAALFLTWRGFSAVWPYKDDTDNKYLVNTAVLVNGILLALLAFSMLLTLYAMISSSGSNTGLGGLGDIMKNINEIQKQIPK